MRAWIEVFSSAQSTYSPRPSRRPAQRRAYRSRTTAAFSLNAGSRGKIQLRCAQGRRASSASQRQIVVPEISATIPWRTASARMSGTCRREKGSSSCRGGVQAIAFTATTTSGGKSPGPPRALLLLEALEASLEEALAPGRHDLAADVEAAGDLVVAQARRGARSSPARPRGTGGSACVSAAGALRAPWRRGRSRRGCFLPHCPPPPAPPLRWQQGNVRAVNCGMKYLALAPRRPSSCASTFAAAPYAFLAPIVLVILITSWISSPSLSPRALSGCVIPRTLANSPARAIGSEGSPGHLFVPGRLRL